MKQVDEKPNECCRQERNLGPTMQERKDLTYRRCAVCGCRHFELTVDPLQLKFKGAAL